MVNMTLQRGCVVFCVLFTDVMYDMPMILLGECVMWCWLHAMMWMNEVCARFVWLIGQVAFYGRNAANVVRPRLF